MTLARHLLSYSVVAVLTLCSFFGYAQGDEQSPTPLTDTQMTEGDRVLSALRSPAAAVFAVWEGNGTRGNDPAADLTEEVPRSKDGLVRIRSVSRPTLHYWKPQSPDGRAVIVFPGGGYNGLAAQHEGTEIAAWLNGQGITAFICKYRVPRRPGLSKHHVALEDAQEAMRFVRSNAAAFRIDPKQIGVMGFSAGGHLSAMCLHKAEASEQGVSVLPNFALLIYPAYLTTERDTIEAAAELTPVSSDTARPPVFVAVAVDDPFALGSVSYTLRLRREKTSVELHMYARGGHGKGLQERGYPFSKWTQPAARWLEDLKKTSKP